MTDADAPAGLKMRRYRQEDDAHGRVVLSEFWVLQEKVDMKVSAFSFTSRFLFLGICDMIELSKDERR